MGLVKRDNRKIYSGVHKEKSIAAWADQQGYILKFTHEATGHSTEFPGTITSFTDTHASDMKMTMLYKEADPIVRTQNSMRKISFNFFVANASIEEARHNARNLNLLLCMMYPRRDKSGAVLPPGTLLRVKGLKFIDSELYKNARIDSNGIGVYIQSLTYSPDLEAGFVTSKGTGIFAEDELYPARITVDVEADVKIDIFVDDDWLPLPENYPSYR